MQIPEDPEALDDEALQELQDELTADFDIGYSIKDSIIPRAVEWWVLQGVNGSELPATH